MDELSPIPVRQKIKNTAIDAVTLTACFTAAVLGCKQGPVAGGIAVAVVTLPVICSTLGILFRHTIRSENALGRFSSETFGLKHTITGLKNAFNDGKVAVAAAALMVFTGGGAAIIIEDSHDQERKRAEYAEKMNALPILPNDTVIQRTEIKAVDLCMNGNGGKMPSGYEFPHIYNGREYKIICP